VTHPGWSGWTGGLVPPEAPADQARIRRRLVEEARARRRRIVRRVLIGLGVLVLLVVVAGVLVGLDAMRARDALTAAASEVQTLQSQVRAGDAAGAATTLTELQAHSATARTATHGPLWRFAVSLPKLGADVTAVQTVSEVVDDLATRALPALMNASTIAAPSALAPVGGRINLAPVIAAAPEVVAADASVMLADERLAGIDTSQLLASVVRPVEELRGRVKDVATTTGTAARAVQLIPAMFGADGPRDYLLLVQNNAEPRATGGIPGTVLLLRANDGAVEIVDQRAGGSLAGLAAPVLPLTPGEDALFGPLLGTDMRDVTFTPDFPRTGALARAIWEKDVGGQVDGVLSIDPGALAEVLKATGPVTLKSGETLTADNAVQALLNTVYLKVADPKAQDAYFTSTATSVFAAVMSGQGSPSAAVDALSRAATEGRVMVWSARETEQALLSGTVLSGELRGQSAGSPVIGVYLNDGTEAKMGYYLDLKVAAKAGECRPDGSRLVDLSVTLTSKAPADAAQLPRYLTGGGAVVTPGETRTNVLIYAPEGGGIDSHRVNSSEEGLYSELHNGLSVGARTFTLKPGESASLDLVVRTGKGQRGTPIIRVTPTAGTPTVTVSGPTCAP
jgi:Protein of unknown function (DUF4012)